MDICSTTLVLEFSFSHILLWMAYSNQMSINRCKSNWQANVDNYKLNNLTYFVFFEN